MTILAKGQEEVDSFCNRGTKQSPVSIDANELIVQKIEKGTFTLIGFEKTESKNPLRISYIPTRFTLSRPGFEVITPLLQFHGDTFYLKKIWLFFKHNLNGSVHKLQNFGEMGRAIGEIQLEFKLCHQDPNVKKYFIIASMLVTAETAGPRINRSEIVDFDLFIPTKLVKNIIYGGEQNFDEVAVHFDYFIPRYFTGAAFYHGSFMTGQCEEDLPFLIFDRPILINPGRNLKMLYSKRVDFIRPLQNHRIASYYKRINFRYKNFNSMDFQKCLISKDFQTYLNDSKIHEREGAAKFWEYEDETKNSEDDDGGMKYGKDHMKNILPRLPFIVGSSTTLYTYIVEYYLIILLLQTKVSDMEEIESENDRTVSSTVQPTADIKNPELLKKLVWEYQLNAGSWVKYEDIICARLNYYKMSCIISITNLHGLSESIPDRSAEFELDESKLQVDLNLMKQKNLDTGFVRPVRCAIQNDEGEHRLWEYMSPQRRWRSVDPISFMQLENAHLEGSASVNIILLGNNFTADLQNYLIKSDDGLTEYKIRSSISNAQPAISAKPVPTIERLRAAKRIAIHSETPLTIRKRKRNVRAKTANEQDNKTENVEPVKSEEERNETSFAEDNNNSNGGVDDNQD
ncbi:unnamed protein product [Thelazia callipaeda]|uniref:WWE domain-containing protein n=1 Tax=Thelazia callipaeda TaxID=103827 RepID=A0A0N5CMN7_THECL|nr:unnamed protein product [Thelazia callipaeda]